MEIIKIKEQSINAAKLYKKMLDSLGVIQRKLRRSK